MLHDLGNVADSSKVRVERNHAYREMLPFSTEVRNDWDDGCSRTKYRADIVHTEKSINISNRCAIHTLL